MAHASSASNPLYGLMAEFEDVNSLTEAAKRTYAEGYRKMDAYSPFPIEPVWEAMHVHDRPVSFFVLCAGIVGMISGFGLCYWVSTIAYPLNVGGRPLNSWPAFIPVTFELRASQDKFFLAIEAKDPKFDRTKTFEFLKSLGPREINEVEN
jgi:hypothetical protein